MGFFYSQAEELEQQLLLKEHKKEQRKVTGEERVQQQAKKGCAACPLDRAKLSSPKMQPSGSDDPRVYILGEAPGETEDEEGEHFVGASGRFLRRYLPKRYLPYFRFNNTIRCRPREGAGNRNPSPLELACCTNLQVADIERTRPFAIFGLGEVPLQWVTGVSLRMKAWRGRRIPVRVGRHECWYYPMYHPTFLIRMGADVRGKDELERAFKRDIERALAECFELQTDFPSVEPSPAMQTPKAGVTLLDGSDGIDGLEEWLHKASKWKKLAIDFETNGYRPYSKDRKILSVAISNYKQTLSFAYQHREHKWGKRIDKVREVTRNFLLSSGKKFAHNLNFEMEWAAEEWGEEVLWDTEWGDTMAQAYILDERKGAKSLEALTVMRLGFNVKALSPGMNMSKLDSYPLSVILPYNAYDAKYTYPLIDIQYMMLEIEDQVEVYEEQARRSRPLVLAQRLGVKPNPSAIVKLANTWQQTEKEILSSIVADKDVVRYTRLGHPFKPSTPDDVLKFLRWHLGKDKKGNERINDTKEGTLATIRHPVAAKVLDLRGSQKLLSTYILPIFPRNQLVKLDMSRIDSKDQGSIGKHVHDDGLVHTQYNHCLTATRRLSSEDPNLQNQPIREHPEIREGYEAPPGCVMVSFDFGQIEARVLGMASLDKFLCEALWTDYDIHGEWASRLARRLGHKEIVRDEKVKGKLFKAYRAKVKNAWVFPLFFGASIYNVSTGLDTEPDAIEDDYDEFWAQFEGVQEWQQKTKEGYDRVGYVSTLTGFRRHAPLSWNELINQPIQGTAADIMMDGMERISDMAHAKGMPYLQPRLTIHDDLGFYFPQDDLDRHIELAAKLMCTCEFSFINVPIIAEMKAGLNWYSQQELYKFSSTMWSKQ